jgi:serine/threonine-protein kinase
LSVGEALDVATQLADGLAALAAEGMVHRDLKPPNVLLEKDGTALITDFGLVRDTKGTALTRVGQAIGSPHYMAPEQIRGETVLPATDVYSLGCLLCECLSGAPPFAHEQGMQVLWAQLTKEPPDPCADRSDAPAGLGAAVLRALAKEVEDRPAGAPEYVRAVREAAGL